MRRLSLFCTLDTKTVYVAAEDEPVCVVDTEAPEDVTAAAAADCAITLTRNMPYMSATYRLSNWVGKG